MALFYARHLWAAVSRVALAGVHGFAELWVGLTTVFFIAGFGPRMMGTSHGLALGAFD